MPEVAIRKGHAWSIICITTTRKQTANPKGPLGSCKCSHNRIRKWQFPLFSKSNVAIQSIARWV